MTSEISMIAFLPRSVLLAHSSVAKSSSEVEISYYASMIIKTVYSSSSPE